MEEAKARFLFGEVPPGADLDDEGVRAELLGRDPSITGGRRAVLELLAVQIDGDQPPETWQTAQRLLEAGLERAAVLGQLTMALAYSLRTLVGNEEPFDAARYADLLSSLPLPSVQVAANALIEAVRRRPGLVDVDLLDVAAADLGRAPDDPMAGDLLEHLLEELIDEGPLGYVGDDQVVHVDDLVRGIVLTHRLSGGEVESGILETGADLAGFAQREDLRLATGEVIEMNASEGGDTDWCGPQGWLAPYPAGSLLAVRVDEDGSLSLALSPEPVPDNLLARRARAAYDQLAGEQEQVLPISTADLVLTLLWELPDTFSEPRPPLGELCRAAGLEVRGNAVAANPDAWIRRELIRTLARVHTRLDREEDRRAATRALIEFLDPGASPSELRSALGQLRDLEPLNAVVDELTGDETSEEVAVAANLVQRLLQAARHPEDVAVAQWIAAVVAERRGDVLEAEAHVQAAVSACPLWEPAADRAAWYASDRGDASTAAELWGRLGGHDAELDVLAGVDRPAPSRPPGRNEACWCGSGRKFKQCHLGRPALGPLQDRVSWLCQKAITYLDRQAEESADDLFMYATARAVDPQDPESVAEAFEDPIVTDVALVEGGWFLEFLEERGPLLPGDELLLAQAWELVARSVYEILEVRRGSGVTVRDLATGSRIDVRERTFSNQAQPGRMVCARAVPDGEGHQFVGALFPVLVGTESEVMQLCQDEDGVGLCLYAGQASGRRC